MSPSSKETLDTIEKLLINEMANPREALEAAYRLGSIDATLRMMHSGEYAEAMIRRDLAQRHEGRPEHDMDTRGNALEPGR